MRISDWSSDVCSSDLLLTALAHPGRAVTLSGAPEGPLPLDPATTAAALTLLDGETPLWIDWIADTPPLRTYLKFHCGCPLVERSQVAAFALDRKSTRLNSSH